MKKFESREEDLVLSHNDFHAGNILKCSKDQDKFHLVDFDFSCINILGWDLANIVAWHMMPYNVAKREDAFTYSPQNYLSDENLREQIKAYLILLSDNWIKETGMEFIVKLREGAYDNCLDSAKFERMCKEFSEIAFLNCHWYLLHAILMADSPDIGAPIDTIYGSRSKILEFFRSKLE